jgi:hypothetical protein
VPDDIRQALDELPRIGVEQNLVDFQDSWTRLEVWVREA